MDDIDFSNPDHVVGAVLAQIEDLTREQKLDVLLRVQNAVQIAGRPPLTEADEDADPEGEEAHRVCLADVLELMEPHAEALYGNAYDSVDRMLEDLTELRAVYADDWAEQRKEDQRTELSIRKKLVGDIGRILESAEAHGENSDNPEHEAGDLVDFIRMLVEESPIPAIKRASDRYWEDHSDWRPSADEGGP